MSIVALIPAFKQAVVPPLDDGIAECLAIFWTIATTNDKVDDAIAQQIVTLAIAQPWSSWRGNEAGFQTSFEALCEVMTNGIEAGAAMFGDFRPSSELYRTLFALSAAKAALAMSERDDTDEGASSKVTTALGAFHVKAWPLMQTVVGQSRPIRPAVAQQSTGCLVFAVGLAQSRTPARGTHPNA